MVWATSTTCCNFLQICCDLLRYFCGVTFEPGRYLSLVLQCPPLSECLPLPPLHCIIRDGAYHSKRKRDLSACPWTLSDTLSLQLEKNILESALILSLPSGVGFWVLFAMIYNRSLSLSSWVTEHFISTSIPSPSPEYVYSKALFLVTGTWLTLCLS